MTSSSRQGGFTYLAILFVVMITGLGIASLSESWSHARQREKEAELLWVGNQFKQAIGLYYERSPGAVKRYPEKLEDLLKDSRFIATQRYLRRIYADPITGKVDWDPIAAPGGGMMGVRSRSDKKPIGKMSTVSAHRDWEFVYEPLGRLNTANVTK